MVKTQDRIILNRLIRLFDKERPSLTPDRLIIRIGQCFLGAPYVAGTLETNTPEHLIVNLREYDCFTFVENVVALAWFLRSRQKSFQAFQKLLKKIRYRQGRLQGYPSRLHYFSDWVQDNQKKGFVRDVTADVGGTPFTRTLAFMTAHPDLYPPLKEAAHFLRMKFLERTISKRCLCFIPKKALRRLEDRIRDGDLVAVTTNKEGLDIEHVGIAVRVENRIHLLHASSAMGKVVLSENTLYHYLMQNKTRSGLMMARVL